jgi:hypothetical protein
MLESNRVDTEQGLDSRRKKRSSREALERLGDDGVRVGESREQKKDVRTCNVSK